MAQKRKNNNKMNMNMPRPSFLWIYGLIGIILVYLSYIRCEVV